MLSTLELYHRLVNGIGRFAKETGKDGAIVGISGGIDSAVVTCLAIDALGKEKVHGLLMPGPLSTVHSLTDGIAICETNEIEHKVIPIDSVYSKILRELSPLFEHSHHNAAEEEKIQSRIRAIFLMYYAGQKNVIALNTINKSELAMDYGTIYGDLAGDLMVIGDIFKSRVYELAGFINRDIERIPWHTIRKEPSADLAPEQTGSYTIPPFPVLDPILEDLIEHGRSAEEVIGTGANPESIRIVTERISYMEYAVLQCPPVLAVSERPLLPQHKCLYFT